MEARRVALLVAATMLVGYAGLWTTAEACERCIPYRSFAAWSGVAAAGVVLLALACSAIPAPPARTAQAALGAASLLGAVPVGLFAFLAGLDAAHLYAPVLVALALAVVASRLRPQAHV